MVASFLCEVKAMSKKKVMSTKNDKKLTKDELAKKYGLNEKQQLFCEYFLETNVAVQSYMKAYPASNYQAAGANSNRLLKQDKVKAYLEVRTEQIKSIPDIATSEDVLKRLTILAFDNELKPSEQLKALELLGKTHALFVDRQQINQINDFEINLVDDYIDMPSEQLDYTDADFEENEEGT